MESLALSLFTDDMIVYIGNPIASTKKLLNLISEFGKIAGYKVDIQKLMEFLSTNNEILEKQTRGINLICYSLRKIKYLGINLTKQVKDLHLESYRISKEEFEEDRNRWKHIRYSWIGRINIIKMATVPKAI